MTVFLWAALAVVLIWSVLIYNRLVRDRNRVQTAWSDIDVQLKRRHDLVPKLVRVVDQYAAFERATLETLIELRSRSRQTQSVARTAVVEGELGRGLGKLFALVEAYPELRADRNFLQLQHDLTAVENQIQYARRYYNGAVRNLNTRIGSFPDLLIARIFGFVPEPFFELDSPAESGPPVATVSP